MQNIQSGLITPYFGYIFAITITVVAAEIACWRHKSLLQATLLSLLLIGLTCLIVKLFGTMAIRYYERQADGYYIEFGIWPSLYKNGNKIVDENQWSLIFEFIKPYQYAITFNNHFCITFFKPVAGYLLTSLCVSAIYFVMKTVFNTCIRNCHHRNFHIGAIIGLCLLLACCFTDRLLCITPRFLVTNERNLQYVVLDYWPQRATLDSGVMVYDLEEYEYSEPRYLPSAFDDSIRFKTEKAVPIYARPSNDADIIGFLSSISVFEMNWYQTTDRHDWMYCSLTDGYVRISAMFSAFSKNQETPLMGPLFRYFLFQDDAIAFDQYCDGRYISTDMMRKFIPLEYAVLIPAILLLLMLYMIQWKRLHQ